MSGLRGPSNFRRGSGVVTSTFRRPGPWTDGGQIGQNSPVPRGSTDRDNTLIHGRISMTRDVQKRRLYLSQIPSLSTIFVWHGQVTPRESLHAIKVKGVLQKHCWLYLGFIRLRRYDWVVDEERRRRRWWGSGKVFIQLVGEIQDTQHPSDNDTTST